MKATTVRFDDQAGVSPKEVGHKLAITDTEGHIDLRPGKPTSTAHTQEHALQITASSLGLGVKLVEEKAKPGNTPTAPAAPNESPQCSVIENPQHLCLGNGLPQFPNGSCAGEIKQSPLDAGAGDPVDAGAIRRAKRFMSVGIDPVWAATTPARSGDVDGLTLIGTQSPEFRRRSVRKHSIRATSNHRRHEPPVTRQPRTTNRVNAVVNPVQPPGGNTLVYGPHRQAQLVQLSKRNNTVLSISNRRNSKIPPPMGLRYAYMA